MRQNFTFEEFLRLANNFYMSKGLSGDVGRISLDGELFNYINSNVSTLDNKKNVALVFICLNPLYWEYAKEMVDGARKFLLPGHQVDFFFWTDIPQDIEVAKSKILDAWCSLTEKGIKRDDPNTIARVEQISQGIQVLRADEHIHFISTEPIEWPYPTLLRYNLFLQEEEALKKYDYIFYCDVDMRFEGIVGDEILGNGITAAQHPMYAIKKQLWPPYEPNPESASYIERPGKIIMDNGMPRFMPLYYAGGFQGGKSKDFIKAMKNCKEPTEKDLSKNYIPIWNDESVWNKYLSINPPDVVLTPAYIYPDSLIQEYYIPLWGQDYPKKLVTLTKWFSTNKAGGDAVQKMLNK